MAEAKPTAGMPLPDAVAGNFQEAVRWFNQMWGGAGDAGAGARASGPIPAALLPTLDIKELDKRIADLRSVEHWLQLNQGLLHTTIQGLEMQRNTLAAWQSFGAAASGTTGAQRAGAVPEAGGGAPGAAPTAETPAFQPALWWSALQQQFAQMAAAAAAGEPAAQPARAAGAAADDAAPAGTTGGARKPAPRAAGSKPRAAEPDTD
jgi:hypothetical protein